MEKTFRIPNVLLVIFSVGLFCSISANIVCVSLCIVQLLEFCDYYMLASETELDWDVEPKLDWDFVRQIVSLALSV